ncbi:hypothetical protein HNP55_000150 [Paucibacter oligotrophus]|uniref:YCII-related domain-containing protein n=1 Tax=Roseateles oligotrophus TaxID=1769250 RepID=A0A840L543_9BURK|nr:YciI family protein [Roseateles oligotrophus]MBB4841655.1 hypothetical protein [Roseateles oligotrophus]
MSYALLIIEDPAQRSERSRAEGEALYAQMAAFGAALHDKRQLKAAESLGSHQGAQRVRSGPQGRMQITDGPFAEAKEMIGGFFLLQNVSHAEALEIAQRCPAAQWATVELRRLAPCFDGSEGQA